MSQENQGQNGGANKQAVSWGTKARYIGTGIFVGLVIYPFVKQAVRKLQPKLDELLDAVTGKAESFAEKSSDILARAKDGFKKSESEKADKKAANDHPHAH